MIEKKKQKPNNLVPMNKEELGQVLDDLKSNPGPKKVKESYRCNLCTYLYSRIDMVDDEEIGYICKNCAKSKKELDDEEEETATMIREEKKSKALP